MLLKQKEIEKMSTNTLADILIDYHFSKGIVDEEEYRLFVLIRELGELRIDDYNRAIQDYRSELLNFVGNIEQEDYSLSEFI